MIKISMLAILTKLTLTLKNSRLLPKKKRNYRALRTLLIYDALIAALRNAF